MKKTKKLLSLLICICLFVSAIPFGASAVDEYETIASGSSKSISITTANEVKTFSFTPSVSGAYKFYSTGDGTIERQCRITDSNDNELCSTTGWISYNFIVVWNFEAGTTYHLSTSIARGTTDSYTIHLEQAPEISSLSFTQALVVRQYQDGIMNSGYVYNSTSEEYEYHTFFQHQIAISSTITVTFDNEDTLSCDLGDLQYLYGYQVSQSTDETAASPWSAGQHSVGISCGTFSNNYTVTFTESPVASIELTNASYTAYENDPQTGTYQNVDIWNSETEQYESQQVFFYNVFAQGDAALTIHYKNNDTVNTTVNGLYSLTNINYQLYSDQDCVHNPWGLGEHTVTFFYLGATVNYTYTIIKDPIASISVSCTDNQITEGTNMSERTTSVWNSVTSSWDESSYNAYNFYSLPLEITINFTDGSSTSCSTGEVYSQSGFYLNIIDDQSASNLWQVGNHQVTFMVHNAKFVLTVEIVASPITSFTVTCENNEIIKGTHGNLTHDYISGSNTYTDDYYCYSIDRLDDIQITLNYTNGDEVTYNLDDFESQTDFNYYCTSNQSYDNQWDVGTHSFTFSILGKTANLEVVIAASPLRSIAVISAETQYPQHFNTSFCYDANYDYENSCFSITPYYFYNIDLNEVQLRLTYNNGSTVDVIGNYDALYEATGYADYFPDAVTDQSSDSPWGVGTHTVTVSYLGVSTTYDIEIVERSIGDINGDGDVSLNDYSMSLQAAVGLVDNVYSHTSVYDVNFDGAVDAFDSFLIDKAMNGYAALTEITYIGDVNQDGIISFADKTQLLSGVSNPTSIASQSKYLYDLNDDGTIDNDDVLVLESILSLSRSPLKNNY